MKEFLITSVLWFSSALAQDRLPIIYMHLHAIGVSSAGDFVHDSRIRVPEVT